MDCKKLTKDELTQIYHTHMKRDFPPSELKPLSHILRSEEEGFGFTLGIFEDGELSGYAVFIVCEEAGCALLDYFAMLENRRGKGLGHCAFSLFETYFQEQLSAVDGLYIESERVSAAENEAQRLIRERRIAWEHQSSLEALDTLYRKMFKPEHYVRFVSLGMMAEDRKNAAVQGQERQPFD